MTNSQVVKQVILHMKLSRGPNPETKLKPFHDDKGNNDKEKAFLHSWQTQES